MKTKKTNKISNGNNHSLHLCTTLNIKEIVLSYLGNSDVFVTNNILTWKTKFSENGIKCPIKRPDEILNGENVIVDGSSLGAEFKKWEKKWEKQNKAVCIYNIDELDPSILKHLVNNHDKMLLSTNRINIISNKKLEKEIQNYSPEVVEKLIKRELKDIVLSLLLSKPMSGVDLVKILYQKFKVFISPGMLYPTLHELEKKGFLIYKYELKNKVYSVQGKKQAEFLLVKHARVSSLLSQFLAGVKNESKE